MIPEDTSDRNVSAIYYPVGRCDLVVHNLNIQDCDKCIFVGYYQHPHHFWFQINFMIPYPNSQFNEKGTEMHFAILNPTKNLTQQVLEKNFTFIPLPKENSTQDIIIR